MWRSHISPESVRRAAASENGGLAGGEDQVVEELRRQARLEHGGVELLQLDVAAEGEAAPAVRDAVGVGRCLDGAQPPAVEVGDELLAAQVDVLEAGAVEEGGEGEPGAKAWTSTSLSSRWPAASSVPLTVVRRRRPWARATRRATAARAATRRASEWRRGGHRRRSAHRRTPRFRPVGARAGTRPPPGRGRGCGEAPRDRGRDRSSPIRTAAVRPRCGPSPPRARAVRRWLAASRASRGRYRYMSRSRSRPRRAG